VGNNVQEVLQRRGDKKRQGFRLRFFLPLLLLFLTYLGLLLDFTLQRRVLWFVLSAATVAIYSFFHLFRKDKKYSVPFLFSLLLLVAGASRFLALSWLRMAYFPFITALVPFYGPGTVISLVFLVPFLELNNLLRGEVPLEYITFMLFLVITAGISLSVKRRLAGASADLGASAEREEVGATGPGAETKSVSDGSVLSDYFGSMFRPDDEIRELLVVAKNTVFADSVNLFLNSGTGMKLRSSTEESGSVIPSDGGLINLCIKEKKALVTSDLSEKKLEAGYLKKDRISSLVVVPVTDGDFPLGVVSADSSRFHAFSSADSEILQTFSRQIMRVLQRERVYPQIQRSYESLKILGEESSRLLSSLNAEVIVKNLTGGAYRIIPTEMVFFTVRGNEFDIFYRTGRERQEKKSARPSGTLLDFAVKNREPVYISDVREYRSQVMPFKTDDVGSVFVSPLLYERDILGILVLLMEKTNALDSRQRDLLGVLVNQAATSLANARFHAEIERLAVTDGLTGLFNHRHFQERLAHEFDRLGRFEEPASLLLIDIDFFKKINDTYGHPVGDSVLKKVADIIRKTIRTVDIPARYGGEEFAVILIGTDAGGAMKMAERLRKYVADARFSSGRNSFSITISIGISTYAKDVKGKEALIERTDKALYDAKGSGRNRSILWSETKPDY
jgi:diguanylate cyclase (GGDEF)-like protein